MNKNIIKKLKSNVINQIAAGEVVDNPASIIKELIENSIDAKANQIEIILTNSGLNSITIKDDGIGMTKHDLQNSYNRFTTSKIHKADDLYQISTLGFRGEALASISSISEMQITTKHKDSSKSHMLHIKGGEKISIKPSPINNGTKIKIDNLFYNVPARKKFLDTFFKMHFYLYTNCIILDYNNYI